MLILVVRYAYINAVPISKYVIVALCIITSIKHLAIMMKDIVSLQNKSYSVDAKLERYAHINWERYIYKCSADIYRFYCGSMYIHQYQIPGHNDEIHNFIGK